MEDLLAPLRAAAHRTPGGDAPRAYVERVSDAFRAMLDGGAGETEAHNFLRENPYLLVNGIMGPAANLERVALFPKVSFARELETDFAFVTADSDGARWTFVELEDPCDSIFKKSGDPHPGPDGRLAAAGRLVAVAQGQPRLCQGPPGEAACDGGDSGAAGVLARSDIHGDHRPRRVP